MNWKYHKKSESGCTDLSEQGSFFERLLFGQKEQILFGRRFGVVTLFALITVFLAYHAVQLRPEASFLRMIPTYHPYIQNFMKHQEALKGMGNAVRISVEAADGNIFSREYMLALQKINDEVFFIPGVDRGALKSLWTPATRWIEVTEQGFAGGPVIPDRYDGSPESLEKLRVNVLKSGEVGSLVANDLRSTVVHAPLLDIDPETRKPLDYQLLSERLEGVRTKYQNDKIRIHITGFAKIVGDLIEGASKVILFFGIAFLIMIAFLYGTSRCVRSTAVRAISSIVAVIWQLGLLRLFGYGLNPYSMLVPFLMFALGVSHGIQMTNGIVHEMAKGQNSYWAARHSFRKLYAPGLAALATDAIGFAVLIVIRIGVIQDIAIGASLGVIVVAFTDLMLLPILMSYLGPVPRRSRGPIKARAWTTTGSSNGCQDRRFPAGPPSRSPPPS
jgi:predicted RND superfamily exporter protein